MAAPYKPHQPGIVRCLGGCDKKFASPDRCCIRICPSCKRKAGRDYVPNRGSASVYVRGRRFDMEE